MKIIIKLFGVLIILAGISLIFDPDILFGWIEESLESRSLYMMAIIGRLILGVLFILSAKESKYPVVIKFFGYLFIIAAIIFIFIGDEIFYDFFSSLIPGIRPYATVSGLINIGIGSFLIYSFSVSKR